MNEDIIKSCTLNCSQKVFGSFCETYGISLDIGLRMTQSLGGGLRAGEACGALTGALLVVGLKYGSDDLADGSQRRICDEQAADFSKRFRALNGSITCRDLLGIDTSLGSNRSIAKEKGLFRDICPGIIIKAVELLEELGYGDAE
ncbi:MAG: C-GCAxxG-C-C family protein [Eubacteriales bacterium]|jgi:C_GCAxxG_C_C family probable redox protein|nr:C-GCAxxG-C-C family protein [Eubacteriales bacterium]NLV69253.1 C_GCAxxG_C_C family protein [Clostridiales bacterium]HPF18719.1 C-GCAxxG-C-C family protein [Bacillota bacterium]HRV33737.1 C-GCAxxG-C-C family protein [Anaerovoracaceae bacterium]MDD3537796.1 C-GCAxxG-C-C family protein [Eubacteriales bacterium]